jgi:hypothetical protein
MYVKDFAWIITRSGVYFRQIVQQKHPKVKLFLCLINYARRHDEVWGSGGRVPLFLTSVLDGGEWPVSRSGRWETTHGTHFIGGWVE